VDLSRRRVTQAFDDNGGETLYRAAVRPSLSLVCRLPLDAARLDRFVAIALVVAVEVEVWCVP
jgi:hypothetical protein